MYKNILVPIALDHAPNSGKALDVARRLADADTAITILNVVEEMPAHIVHHLPEDYAEMRRSEAATMGRPTTR